MTRQAYALPEHELVIFWTPKAACTSIVFELCFTVFGLPKGSLSNQPGGMRGWLAERSYHRSAEEARHLCATEGYTSIAMLREPYDRLISAYLNKFVRNANKDLQTLGDLEPFAREFYETTASSDGAYTGLSFRQFVQQVCGTISNRGMGEPALNHHWNTQVPFAFATDGFEYDHLYKLSSADQFFTQLGELTGSTIENNKTNTTAYSDQISESLVDVPSAQLANHDAFAKESFRDDQLAELVAKAFAVDLDYHRRAR